MNWIYNFISSKWDSGTTAENLWENNGQKLNQAIRWQVCRYARWRDMRWLEGRWQQAEEHTGPTCESFIHLNKRGAELSLCSCWGSERWRDEAERRRVDGTISCDELVTQSSYQLQKAWVTNNKHGSSSSSLSVCWGSTVWWRETSGKEARRISDALVYQQNPGLMLELSTVVLFKVVSNDENHLLTSGPKITG